ncbi:MAG TPA: putative collagen-binding domain-containing protein, partial [Gemmataceae bacterium]|nr:putative collagen-binding domain-containing protein [Gemmataceae bacterium]
VVYLPRPLAVTVHKLESNKRYTASFFDPASGRRTENGPIRPDDQGDWTQPPPQSARNDWILLLEASSNK